MLPRSRLGSVRIAVVSLALLLAACAAPASSRQLGATTAPTPQGLSTALAVLPATAPPTLPPTAELAPSAVPTPPDLPTVAPTAAPTAAPSPAPTVAPPVEAGPPAGLPTGMVERVIDGDTVDVRLGGDTVRVRLIGIDTPEVVDPRTPVECFGREASAKAHELLDGQSVAIEDDPTQGDADRYGRLLRYLWLPDGRLFNQEMIGQGYAFEYTYDQCKLQLSNPHVYSVKSGMASVLLNAGFGV